MSNAVPESGLNVSAHSYGTFGDLERVKAPSCDLRTENVAVIVEGKPEACCDNNDVDSTGRDAGGGYNGAKNVRVAKDHPLDALPKHARPSASSSASSYAPQRVTPREPLLGTDILASLGTVSSQDPTPCPEQQQKQPRFALRAPVQMCGSSAESVVERWAPGSPAPCDKPDASTAGTPTSPREYVSRSSTGKIFSSAVTTITEGELYGTVPYDCAAEQRRTPGFPTREDDGEDSLLAGNIKGLTAEEVRVSGSPDGDERRTAAPLVHAGGGKMHADVRLDWWAGDGEHEAAAGSTEGGKTDEVSSWTNPLFVGGRPSHKNTAGVGRGRRGAVGKEIDVEVNHACSEVGDATPPRSLGDPFPLTPGQRTGDNEEGAATVASVPVTTPLAGADAAAGASAIGNRAATDSLSLETWPSDDATVDASTARDSPTALPPPPPPSSLPEENFSLHPDSDTEEDRTEEDETGAAATNALCWRETWRSASTSVSEAEISSDAGLSVSAGRMSSGSSDGDDFFAIPVILASPDAGGRGDCNVDDPGEVGTASSSPRPYGPAAVIAANGGGGSGGSGGSTSSSSGSTSSEGLRVFARFRSSARGGARAVTRLLRRRTKVAAAAGAPEPPLPDTSAVDQVQQLLPPPNAEAVYSGSGGSNSIVRKLPAGFAPNIELSGRAYTGGGKLWAAGGGGDGGVLPSLTVPDMDKSGLKPGGRRAPQLRSHEIPGKTPLVSPLCSSPSSLSSTASATSSSLTATAAAGAAIEVEGDLEEGGEREAAARLGEDATTEGVAVSSVPVAEVDDAVDGLVLPCAPTDEEKVLYHRTGRTWLVACALVAFVALSWGMWLFTIVTPAFYWFGVPAAFLVFYTAAHYIGVAIWGKDFQPDVHAEVLHRSRERGYEPSVDVFLPVCKEPLHLLANTWKYVSALDYPDAKINVFVLDDGVSGSVRDLAAEFGFEYVVRDNVPELKKAGNLRNAFARTSGEAIAIFDADFCPRPDFLRETVPYLGEDPSVGIVQTPQFFRLREEQTWVEQGAGVSQEFFYRLVQMNQERFHAAVCVGSCGLYRRTALEPLGGMAAIAHSEDMYTGYKMTEYGFKIKYVPLALAMGICPDEPQSFFMQQYRWCKGSASLVTKMDFWRSEISNLHKLCLLNGMLYYMATALLVFVSPLPILLLVWMVADGVLWYHSAFVLPAIIFALVVMPLWSKQRYGMACHRIKIIQCYAHMFAIKDTMIGYSAPWIPSGRGGRLSSSSYKSSVRLMVTWNAIVTSLILGGSIWRMTELTWYHFAPAVVLAVGSFVLNMSTLVY